MKNKVTKITYNDIPFYTVDWMPKNEIWFTNNELPIDIFDPATISANIKAGFIKQTRFITKFDKRRMGKLSNIKEA